MLRLEAEVARARAAAAEAAQKLEGAEARALAAVDKVWLETCVGRSDNPTNDSWL